MSTAHRLRVEGALGKRRGFLTHLLKERFGGFSCEASRRIRIANLAEVEHWISLHDSVATPEELFVNPPTGDMVDEPGPNDDRSRLPPFFVLALHTLETSEVDVDEFVKVVTEGMGKKAGTVIAVVAEKLKAEGELWATRRNLLDMCKNNPSPRARKFCQWVEQVDDEELLKFLSAPRIEHARKAGTPDPVEKAVQSRVAAWSELEDEFFDSVGEAQIDQWALQLLHGQGGLR